MIRDLLLPSEHEPHGTAPSSHHAASHATPQAGGGSRSQPREVRLLIVDDEEPILAALGRYLTGRGFAVELAQSGQAALDALERAPFELMICDVRMPGLSGLDVVRQACRRDPDLAVVMLSGANDASTATGALSNGAMDYLGKPVELSRLQDAIERALHKRSLRVGQRQVERLIREEVALRTEELEREKAALRELTVSVAETLVNAMEAKDVFLRGHSQRVAELGASIAAEMGLDADTVEAVRLAGRLQDVGKIGIREAVLNKPGPLTPEEFEHVKEHVRISMTILSPLKHIGPALAYVQDHHEWWDGTGYPNRRAGEEISIGGRILAAADAFDALTSRRAYRDPLTEQETLALLDTKVGTLLDARVYLALSSVIRRRKALVFLDEGYPEGAA